MKQSHEFQGHGPDLGFLFVNGQYFPKVTTIPLPFAANRLVNTHLMGPGGTISMVGNFTPGAPGRFEFIVPSNAFFVINAVSIVLVDAGIEPLLFGGIPALTNGIKIEILDVSNNVIYNLHAGSPIKSNYEFAHIAGGSQFQAAGNAQDQLVVNWIATTLGVYPTMQPNWKFRITIQDDLTGIDRFESVIAGAYLGADLTFIA